MKKKPFENRMYHKPERLKKMTAYVGVCPHCKSVVKMQRSFTTMELLPRACRCLQCGQRFFMVIDDVDAFDKEQWKQKQDRAHEKILEHLLELNVKEK